MAKNRLTIPALWAQAWIAAAVARNDAAPRQRTLHLTQHDNGMRELLATADNASLQSSLTQSASTFESSALTLRIEVVEALADTMPDPLPGECVLWVTAAGQWKANFLTRSLVSQLKSSVRTLDELYLPGSGASLLYASSDLTGDGERPNMSMLWGKILGTTRDRNGPHSRTAAALGEGDSGWQALENLRRLKVALVGCSRTGSPYALAHVLHNPAQMLLVDPDVIEPGNHDAGFGGYALRASEEQLQRTPKQATPQMDHGGHLFKVDALAERLRSLAPATQITTVNQSVLSFAAWRAVAQCDVIVCAVDDDVARMVCAAVGAAFHRPVLDLGSHVTTDAAGIRLLGADIRLTLPGDRDLSCLGGFAQQDAIQAFSEKKDRVATTDWWQSKAGALSSWSALVASLGLRLLEDLAAQRIASSQWLRLLQQGDAVAPTISQLTAAHDRWCPLCALAGMGHVAILNRMRTISEGVLVRSLRQPTG